VLEQMFGSSNDKRSLSNIPEKNLSSSILFDQYQEEQSSVQKEELKSASLGRPDGPVSHTGVSSFDRIENSLTEEDGCSTSSSDVNDDDTDYDVSPLSKDG
jgi:hypothetical protein